MDRVDADGVVLPGHHRGAIARQSVTSENCKKFKRAVGPDALRVLAGSVPVALRLVLRVAVPAVDWPSLSRFEGDLGLTSAVRTGGVVHLVWPVVPGAAVAAPTLVSVHY